MDLMKFDKMLTQQQFCEKDFPLEDFHFPILFERLRLKIR